MWNNELAPGLRPFGPVLRVACLASILQLGCGGAPPDAQLERSGGTAPTPTSTPNTQGVIQTEAVPGTEGSGSKVANEFQVEPEPSELEDRVRIDTVAGTVVVTNGPTGLWTGEDAWTVREMLRLGSRNEPAEETFGSMVRGALGPDGDLYVLDPQAATIRVFASSGMLVRQFGREGDGPGELAAPTALAWDSLERLWVANAFNGRYTLFDSAGDFIKTVPRPIRGISSRHQLIIDRADSFVDMGSASGAASVPLFRVDTTGTIVDSLARLSYDRPPFASVPTPPNFNSDAARYLSRLYFAAIPGGGAWSAKSEGSALIKTSPEGDTLRVVHFSHRGDLTLDSGTRLEVERELSKLQATGPYQIIRPVISDLEVLPDGHVLVGIAETVGEPSSLYDVYDPEGRYLGPLRFPFGIVPGVSSFRGDTMIVVTRDELDVPYVVRLHLIR